MDIKKRYRNAQIKAAIRVNSEQLYFNWCLGRDLVLLRAEEKWGKGVVEQVALDLQAEFPALKGFSTANLSYMKKGFFSTLLTAVLKKSSKLLENCLMPRFKSGERKLNQTGSQLEGQKLKQVDSEIQFPPFFGLVPWMHHVLIIQKCETVEEALFYIKKTIADNLSRSALENCIRADLYHTAGAAVTNFTETLPDAQGKLAQDLCLRVTMILDSSN
ncbi:MAG: hypothetical protein IJ787_02375 [Bacilli bacterium]|nr:hypothetical protein [Bacilli bacterium]